MKVKYDLAVKTGEYTDRDGNTKGRYENIGKVFQGTDGFFMILKRTFSPAGVPNPEDRDSVMVSMFEPREHGSPQAPQGGRHEGSAPQQGGSQPAPQGGGAFDDPIPF